MIVPGADDMIDEIAAEWVVRRDLRPDDLELQRHIAAWTAQAPAHARAMARATRLWMGLDQLESPEAAEPVAPSRRRRPALLAVCASVAVAAWLGYANMAKVPVVATMQDPQHIVSHTNKDLSVKLADGSTARLKAGSAISVSFDQKQRDIVLERGEAWFEVVKDSGRPFTVSADKLSVRAVGTAFLVIRDGGYLKTVVGEGTVKVTSIFDRKKARSLSQGNGLSMKADGELTTMTSADVREHLAWTRGEVAFRNESLAKAAVRFNAYNEKKIVIADRQLGRAQIIGWFELDEPKRFAVAAAAVTGGKVVEKNGVIFVSRADKGADGASTSD